VEPPLSSLIDSADAGDRSSAETLFATLYAELHRLAQRQLARNGSDLTLGTTSLLHDAYLDFAGREGTRFPDRARFMAYAVRAMRSVVIDHARHRQAQKRGGNLVHLPLSEDTPALALEHQELSRIGGAIDELAGLDPALARVVDLKFFGGFSFAEIADLQGISKRTVQRQWEKARIYLHQALERG
jgi:RNA polymerase sigma factor (TIGR02999 family)